MLRTFLLGEASVPVKKKSSAMGNPKLQRVASAPYSIQVKRMHEVHRTLSESGGSTYRSFESVTEAPAGQDAVVKRKSSLKVRLRDDTGGELSKQSSGKKSVTWRDLEVPGRSISEFHLITPRSCISDRHSHRVYRYGTGGSGYATATVAQDVIGQSRTQGHISLHTNQQLQYYYYHQRASRSPNTCSACLSSIKTLCWGF